VCSGHTLVEQECNTQACPGSWGCWSHWGRCSSSGSQEGGRRSRSRACLADHDSSDAALVDCGEGEGREEEDCRIEDDRDILRAGLGGRKVAADGGPRLRDGVETVTAAGLVSLNMVVGACVAGFMFGGLLGAALVYYYLKNRKPGSLGCGGGNAAVGSPHYISAKSQNLYVSLPMLDMKHKQLSSNASDYSGTLRSNATGTLRSSKAGGGSSVYSGGGGGSKPGDYETATIKRSHSRRDSSLLSGLVGGSGIRADLDSDTLFT